MRTSFIATAIGLAFIPTASAQAVHTGSYLCSVEQTAGIGATHLEGARSPHTFADSEAYRFRIVVSVAPAGRLRIVEAPYEGPNASMSQWEDDNSTLHAAYLGDGRAFGAEDGPGFLNFGNDRWGEGLQFFHSGFQYAGGEDESVAVRWGRCTRE